MYIIQKYESVGYKHFKFFFSGGEPTAWQNLIPISEWLRNKLPNCTLAINTNLSRPLAWWNKHSHLFDDIVASFHVEFSEKKYKLLFKIRSFAMNLGEDKYEKIILLEAINDANKFLFLLDKAGIIKIEDFTLKHLGIQLNSNEFLYRNKIKGILKPFNVSEPSRVEESLSKNFNYQKEL
jgi:organic radical activating enzyme